jgi:PAP2 superfamily C-terminal
MSFEPKSHEKSTLMNRIDFMHRHYESRLRFWFIQGIIMLPILLLCYTEGVAIWKLGYQYCQQQRSRIKNDPSHSRNNSSTTPTTSSTNPDHQALTKQQHHRPLLLFFIQFVQYHMIPLSLVVCIISGQLFPIMISAGIAAMVLALVPLMTIPLTSSSLSTTSHNTKQRYHPRLSLITSNTTLMGVIIMITVLLMENFFIWVVSATYEAGYRIQDSDKPLQDNGQIVLRTYIISFLGVSKSDMVEIRHRMNVQWCLVSCLGTSFIVIDLMNQFRIKYHPYYYSYDDHTGQRRTQNQQNQSFHPQAPYVVLPTGYDRTLYSIGYRGVMTIALARFIRTVAFSITVLPSQIELCYMQRFATNLPPPSFFTWQFIQIGLLPRTHGGCNDLIISGHAVITSALTCIISSTAYYYSYLYNQNHVLIIPDYDEDRMKTESHNNSCNTCLFVATLWYLLVFDYLIEILEGFHYSVDMWLGLVLVVLIWIVLEPLEKLHLTPAYASVSSSKQSVLPNGSSLDPSSSSSPRKKANSTGATELSNVIAKTIDITVPLSTETSTNDASHHTNVESSSLQHPNEIDAVDDDETMLSIRHVIMYALPALIAYLQVIHVFPNSISNYLIIFYTIIAATLQWYASTSRKTTTIQRNKKKHDDDEPSLLSSSSTSILNKKWINYFSTLLSFHHHDIPSQVMTHYAQHILLCLLYMAFGIYL